MNKMVSAVTRHVDLAIHSGMNEAQCNCRVTLQNWGQRHRRIRLFYAYLRK